MHKFSIGVTIRKCHLCDSTLDVANRWCVYGECISETKYDIEMYTHCQK